MRVTRDDVTHLAGCGYLTLQVPQVDVDVQTDAAGKPTSATVRPLRRVEDLPDAWFLKIRSAREVAVGKQGWFLFLSRAGFAANRAALEAAFDASGRSPRGDLRRGTWSDFVRKAEEFHADVERKLARKVKLLRGQIAELEAVVV